MCTEGGLREFNVYSADDLLEQLTEFGHLLKVSAGTYSPSSGKRLTN